jgi:hypothetical protein
MDAGIKWCRASDTRIANGRITQGQHARELTKMKMVVAASLLLVSVQTASAQMNYYPANPYYQSDTTAAENDLANEKARRDKARQERKETGKSDVGARNRLQEECTRAIERGVDDDVRRSHGCGD